MRKRLAAVVAGALALMATTTGIGTAAPAERVEAVCIASMWEGVSALRISVWNPEYPAFWDLTPPGGDVAIAEGFIVFTPGGRMTATCSAPAAAFNPTPNWPSPPFSGSTECDTARGGDPAGIGARVYRGRGTVTTTEKRVTIVCTGSYSHTIAPVA